ncbi:transposase [Streptomyces mirabilis]
MTVSGRRSGRLSVAGLIAMRPGSRTRLRHRLRTHPASKGNRRNLGESKLDRLEVLVRNRLKRLQYRPDTLNGFIARTGLDLDAPTSP